MLSQQTLAVVIRLAVVASQICQITRNSTKKIELIAVQS